MTARHYATMDGLRGVTAIAVMLHHYSPGIYGASALSQGYLAVDLFFLMSGFVLEHAYGRRLAAGMGSLDFLRVRAVRIYPMLVLAGGIAVAAVLVRPEAVPPGRLAAASLLNVLSLPFPIDSTIGYGSWPLNPPTWSVFYELIGSLLFGAWIWRLGTRHLVVATGLCLAGLTVVCLYHQNLDFGPRLVHSPGTAFRFMFSFLAGCLLFRFHGLWRFRVPRPVLYGAVVAALVLPAAKLPVFDLLCVAVLFPLVVLASTTSPGDAAGRGAEVWLGRLSYPLYALHWPLMALAGAIGKHLGGDLLDSGAGLLALSSLTIAAAWLATVLYDEPVRRWLARHPLRVGDVGTRATWMRQRV